MGVGWFHTPEISGTTKGMTMKFLLLIEGGEISAASGGLKLKSTMVENETKISKSDKDNILHKKHFSFNLNFIMIYLCKTTYLIT